MNPTPAQHGAHTPDIQEKLLDLLKQATQERSHYYVASCCREAIATLTQLQQEAKRLRDDLAKERAGHLDVIMEAERLREINGELAKRNDILTEALGDIAGYRGEGPPSTPWRDIVRECGQTARAALSRHEARSLTETKEGAK